MESGGSSQVSLDTNARASPTFSSHQFFPGARARDNMNGGRQSPLSSRHYADSSTVPYSFLDNGQVNGNGNGNGKHWDRKQWDWDTLRFLAHPTSAAALIERSKLTAQGVPNGSSDLFPRPAALDDDISFRRDEGPTSSGLNGSSEHDDLFSSHRNLQPVTNPENGLASFSGKTQSFLRDGSSPDDDTESLSLKLGGHAYAYSDDGNGARDAKRYRSSSPGPQIPACQVDECKSDLSHAKDYLRRHKVCEMHAKAGKALVSRLMQRFCQQCSRFHPLEEFDGDKRSCRRRLAGHNRRRRKNQPDTPMGRGFTGVDDDGTGKAAGLVGFLNILSSLQAVNSVTALNGMVSEREALLQYLKNVPMATPVGLENLSTASIANLVNMSGISETGRPELKPQASASNGHSLTSAAETEALLSALAAPKSTEALSLLLQSSLRGQLSSAILKAAETPLVQVGQSNGNSLFPVASPSAIVPDRTPDFANVGPTLSLSSPMASRPVPGHPRLNNGHKRSSVENPVQRSDLSRASHQGKMPPVSAAQKMYPAVYVNLEDDGATASTSDLEPPVSMATFMEGQGGRVLQDVVSIHTRPTIDLQQPPQQYDAHESSPSGSDQSPSSSYDWQDRTVRISIKLFDRNPGDLPQLLRSQITNWLASSPLDMESYIRPGCTVVTIFLSMHHLEWEKFEKNLKFSLPKLTASHEIWSRGRVLVQLDQQNAYINWGVSRVSKSLNPVKIPKLVSVSPLAVVAGQTTMLVARGYNLRQAETGIFCAYQGKYVLKAEGQEGNLQSSRFSAGYGDGYDELSVSFDAGLPNVVGRAFIEVQKQNGGGNALPVIVADGLICAELQTLEEEVTLRTDGLAAERRNLQSEENGRRMHAMNFLNELGWLFRSFELLGGASPMILPYPRQQHLLTFAVERDWCFLVNKLLEILDGFVSASSDPTLARFVEILGDEIFLLHTAVRRKCKPMVKLLVSYVPKVGQPLSIFTPDRSCRDGLTPLHIAVSMDGADKIIDELTSDPNCIGLRAWSESKNAEGHTPLACALRRRKSSYVQVVATKSARRDGMIVVDIPSSPKAFETVGDRSITRHSTPPHSLELTSWSKKDLLEGAHRRMSVYPSSCRHLPPNLRGFRGRSMRPFLVSMLAIAAVCVCACLVMRGGPEIKDVLRPFSWRALHHGYL